VVSCVAAPPDAGIVQTSASPASVRVKAIVEPSGDHVGPASTYVVVVSLVWLVPSAFMTKTSPALMKASFELSGDHAGSLSRAAFCVRLVAPPTVASPAALTPMT
jgi:hypothetical protein